MSDKREQFKAVLAKLKNNIANTSAGVFVAEKLNALLKNKGVVLVSQKDVRSIDLAVKELQKAHDAISAAQAALYYFPDLNKTRLAEAQATTAEYKAVLVSVVTKAYERRRDAVLGVKS